MKIKTAIVMIKHILKLIWNQRKSNIFLFGELLLVSVFLWFLVDFLYATGVTYFTPTGYHIEHTYRIVLNELTSNSPRYVSPEERTTTPGENLLTIVERIRSYPGVEAVSLSDASYPYSGGFRQGSFRIDTTSMRFSRFKVSPDFFQVFGIQNPRGNSESLMTALSQYNAVVLTVDTEDDMPTKESIVGKKIYDTQQDSVSYTITAVTSPLRRSEYIAAQPCLFRVFSDKEIAKIDEEGEVYYKEICLRVSPDEDVDFPKRFQKEMSAQLAVGNVYLQEVQPFSYIREAFIVDSGARNEVKTQLSIALFLLANIFLGIIGTFWFRTEYRKGEMGLRMALGSQRSQLRTIMISEGLLLLTVAFIPAILINVNTAYLDLIYIDELASTPTRFLITTVITYLLMTAMIIGGVWYPAMQTARLEPAEALHYE